MTMREACTVSVTAFVAMLAVTAFANTNRVTSFVVTEEAIQLWVPVADTTALWRIHWTPFGTADYYCQVTFPFLDMTFQFGFMHGSNGSDTTVTFYDLLRESKPHVALDDPIAHRSIERNEVEVVVHSDGLTMRTSDRVWVNRVVGAHPDSVQLAIRLGDTPLNSQIPVKYDVAPAVVEAARGAFEVMKEEGETERDREYPRRVVERILISVCQEGRALLLEPDGAVLDSSDVTALVGAHFVPTLHRLEAQSFALRGTYLFTTNASVNRTNLGTGETVTLMHGSAKSDFTLAYHDVTMSPTGRFFSVILEEEDVVWYDTERDRGFQLEEGCWPVVWNPDGSTVSTCGWLFALDPHWKKRGDRFQCHSWGAVQIKNDKYCIGDKRIVRLAGEGTDAMAWLYLGEIPWAWHPSGRFGYMAIIGAIEDTLYLASESKVIAFDTQTNESRLLFDAGPGFERSQVAVQYIFKDR